MGFFSFGKKKKPVETTNRPSKLVASASASSSLSAASSGSSGSASPPQLPPKRSQTTPAGPRTLSFRPDTVLHPVPKIPGAISQSSSSSSLNVPNAPYSRDLNKKGSTHTLNSIKSTASGSGRRGAHEAPRIAPELAAWTAKPRASSYHASQVRNIWVTSASETGHAASAVQVNITPTTTKYYSTGSPGVMNRGSYFNGQQSSSPHPTSDDEFRAYAKKYDTAIAKAHTLAREYHHLPPAKRDRERFEQIGHAFASAAQISRNHWSYRCTLEKDRLEALLAQPPTEIDAAAGEDSIHRIAGARATEGWQYASMLADAWGVKDEMAQPLEDMPVLRPTYTHHRAASSSYYDRGSTYMHPGYTQAGYASYVATQAQAAPPSSHRNRLDSNVSAAPSFESAGAHSTSSHTHSAISHAQSQQRLQRPRATSSSSAAVEEPVTRAPVVLTKGRRYRERGSSLAPAVPVTVA